MKEYPNQRSELAEILRATDGKHLLNVTEVADYIGRDRKTARKLFTFENGYISAYSLAKQICERVG